ncbi:MAG: hypothetical protein FWH07_00745 [Oscillospiraceae bacterium]|nr:hypothetical protein [Oscillospiraceae bacterium]
MNKHEFYKELMKEYTFDSAKVRRTSKREKYSSLNFTGRRWWHIPSTVAVAAVSLTVGLFSFFYNAGSGSSPSFPTNGIGESTSALETATLGFGTKTLFLSFNNSITLHEMRNTLDSVSDTGNIVVGTLYILDENNQVSSFSLSEDNSGLNEFNNNSAKIIGAKVYAPAALIDDLKQQRGVSLAEIGSDSMSDDDFIPLIIEEIETPVTETPQHTDETTDSPHESVPPSFEKFVNLSVPDVIEASFIGDYRFIAVTKNAVTLYEISANNFESFEINPVSEHSLSNHRKRSSITGRSSLYIGTNGGKPVLLLADAETQSVGSIDVSDIVGSGELLNAFYDDIGRRIIVRVRDKENNAIYVIDRNTFDVAHVENSSHDAVTLAVHGDDLYFSLNTSIYKYDMKAGVSTELFSAFGEAVSFERNANLSAFVMNLNGESRVFTARNQSFTEWVDSPGGLAFYKNSSELLTDGDSFYTISDGAIEAFTGQPWSPDRQFASDLFKVFELTEDSINILIR